MDIFDPRTGGTLVVFDSRVILHEVMPALDRRMALTLWICDDGNGGSSPLTQQSAT